MNDQKQYELVHLAFKFLLERDKTTTTLDVKNFLHHNLFPIKQSEVSTITKDLFDKKLVANLDRDLKIENNGEIQFFQYSLKDTVDSSLPEEDESEEDEVGIKRYKADLSYLSYEEIEMLRYPSTDWVCRTLDDVDDEVYLYDGSLKHYQARAKYVLDTKVSKDNVRTMRLKNFIRKKEKLDVF